MRSFYCHLIFVLGALAAAVGQEDARKVSCRFLALDSSNAPPVLLNVVDKGGEVSCTVHTRSLSPPTLCFAKGTAMKFLTQSDRLLAATATLPAKGSAFIMVFVASATATTPNGPPWRVFVIEDTLKNFPDGGAFVANFHNQDIRFIIGESKIMLPPAGSHGFPLPAKRDNFNMAPVMFEFEQNDSWRTASESMLRFLPGTRYLIFAYVDPASGRPRIATVQDFPARAKPPAAPR